MAVTSDWETQKWIRAGVMTFGGVKVTIMADEGNQYNFDNSKRYPPVCCIATSPLRILTHHPCQRIR
jgi:hypothetical protein